MSAKNAEPITAESDADEINPDIKGMEKLEKEIAAETKAGKAADDLVPVVVIISRNSRVPE